MQEQSERWEQENRLRTTGSQEPVDVVEAIQKDIALLKYNQGRMHEDVKNFKYLIQGEEGSGWLRVFLAIGMVFVGFGSALSVSGFLNNWANVSIGIALFAVGVVLIIWAQHLARLISLRRRRGRMKYRSARRKFDEFDQPKW